KALRRTGALGAQRIVYVSCNPTTLASDLAVLRDDFGYELVRTRRAAMFPHTPHVESVSLLERSATYPDEARSSCAAARAPGTGPQRRSAVGMRKPKLRERRPGTPDVSNE